MFGGLEQLIESVPAKRPEAGTGTMAATAGPAEVGPAWRLLKLSTHVQKRGI